MKHEWGLMDLCDEYGNAWDEWKATHVLCSSSHMFLCIRIFWDALRCYTLAYAGLVVDYLMTASLISPNKMMEGGPLLGLTLLELRLSQNLCVSLRLSEVLWDSETFWEVGKSLKDHSKIIPKQCAKPENFNKRILTDLKSSLEKWLEVREKNYDKHSCYTKQKESN